MSGRTKVLIYAVVFVGLALLIKFLVPFEAAAVQSSVAVAPEVMVNIPTPFGTYPVSNTIWTAWIVMIFITILAFLATRNMKLVPSGLQNVMEFAIESINGLAESVAGERARKFLVVTATIFIFVLFSNLFGLIPGFGPFGTMTLEPGQKPPQGIIDLGPAPAFFAPNPSEGETIVLAPFFRSPSTDVNLTFAIALLTMVLVEAWGVQANGLLPYLGRFFRFGQLGEFFASLVKPKKKWGLLGMGLIDLVVGLIEFVGEFARLIAFTFRLFGNIFAGEIVLLIMGFLLAALPLIFYGFELFVGFIQAFVFFVLAVAFMTIATTPHEGEGHGHKPEIPDLE